MSVAVGPMDSPWSMKCHDNRNTGRSLYSTADNSGTEKWKYETDSWIETTPIIDNEGKIYYICLLIIKIINTGGKQNILGFNSDPLKCVILCAGNGNRILPYSSEQSKVMIKIHNKPLVEHVIDYWKQYTKDFIFVVGYKKEHIINHVSTLPIRAEFVEQKKLNGIADAVLQVKTYVPDRFIVALGDCLYKGKFQAHNQQLQCIGVYKTNNVTEIKLNYSIELNNDNNVCKVLEKPTHIVNNLCGMGIYLFHRRVFKYIKKTKPSTLRNEIEITDVIQNMINAGELITPAFFNGHYVNITYPEDIQKAERLFI